MTKLFLYICAIVNILDFQRYEILTKEPYTPDDRR